VAIRSTAMGWKPGGTPTSRRIHHCIAAADPRGRTIRHPRMRRAYPYRKIRRERDLVRVGLGSSGTGVYAKPLSGSGLGGRTGSGRRRVTERGYAGRRWIRTWCAQRSGPGSQATTRGPDDGSSSAINVVPRQRQLTMWRSPRTTTAPQTGKLRTAVRGRTRIQLE